MDLRHSLAPGPSGGQGRVPARASSRPPYPRSPSRISRVLEIEARLAGASPRPRDVAAARPGLGVVHARRNREGSGHMSATVVNPNLFSVFERDVSASTGVM